MILRQSEFNQYEDFQKLLLWEKSEQEILNVCIWGFKLIESHKILGLDIWKSRKGTNLQNRNTFKKRCTYWK